MSTYEYVPEELRARDQWVVWRYEHRGGGPTKVPYTLDSGRRASHSNPKTWRPFRLVVRALRTGEWAGIGYVFSEDDPYAGVDFDGVRDPKTGIIEPAALEKLRRLDSYAEVSPSFSGVKVWVRAELPGGRARKKPGLEIYDRRRFFTVTGAFLPFVSLGIEQHQGGLDALIREEFPEPEHKPWRPYAGPIGERIDLLTFLESAGLSILGELADGTAERVYRVVCPWWAEHTGGDKSGTRVGQYAAHRSWADLRALVEPPARLRLRRGRVYTPAERGWSPLAEATLAYETRADGVLYTLEDRVLVKVGRKSANRVKVSMQRGNVIIPPETGDLDTSAFRAKLVDPAREHFGEVNGLADELGLIAVGFDAHCKEREQANLTGDEALTKAVLYRAYQLQSERLVGRYLETRPQESERWSAFMDAAEAFNQFEYERHMFGTMPPRRPEELGRERFGGREMLTRRLPAKRRMHCCGSSASVGQVRAATHPATGHFDRPFVLRPHCALCGALTYSHATA